MTDNEKLLAGCVILYNPADLIITNIESYLNFIDVLYVIDNSEHPGSKLIENLKRLGSKIIYLPQTENIGIASALNKCAALAFESNYQWLLTMDQDSYFLGKEFFDTALNEVNLNGDIGLIAASYTDKYDRWQRNYSEIYNEIHFAVTSGNIINLSAWKNAGGFESKLFIDEVDHDYCLKLRKNKFRILISKKILMGHMIGELYDQKRDNLPRKEAFTLHPPIRYYYISRNVLYVCKKYFFFDLAFVLARFYYLMKRLIKIVLKYPDKRTYIKFFFEGIKDFAQGQYNKYNH